MKVHARQSAVVGMPDGALLSVEAGQEFDRNDPVVKNHRWLFEAPVEQATAGPGERRNVRRVET